MSIELYPLIAGLIGGVFSWFVTQFVAEPLRRFFGMRRDISQRLMQYRNVRGPLNEDVTTPLTARDERRLHEAKDKLRELGTQTLSFIQTDSVATKLFQCPWLWFWHYDLQIAGTALVALSLDIGANEKELKTYRDNIEAALRFKPIGVSSPSDER